MQSPIEHNIMFPARMTSELKSEEQAAAKLLGMNFSQFVRQLIRRNIAFTLELERTVSERIIQDAKAMQWRRSPSISKEERAAEQRTASRSETISCQAHTESVECGRDQARPTASYHRYDFKRLGTFLVLLALRC